MSVTQRYEGLTLKLEERLYPKMASMRYRVQSRVQVCWMNPAEKNHMIGDDEKKSESAIELAFLLALDVRRR